MTGEISAKVEATKMSSRLNTKHIMKKDKGPELNDLSWYPELGIDFFNDTST